MKINFERNENGCFTDNNIANFSMTSEELGMVVIGEVLGGTVRKLHDLFADKNLFIIIPTEDANAEHGIEKVRCLLVRDESECPLENGKLLAEDGRWFEIEDTDFAFTEEEEVDMLLLDVELLAETAHKAAAITHCIECATTLLQPTNEPNEIEVLTGMLAKMTLDLERVTSNPLAQVAFENAKEILAKQ